MAYDREAAVHYALRWALDRNPAYYDFENLGGDCTNFTSQCLFAGSGRMNPRPDTGWYYRSLSDRAPAWTGVKFLQDFLLTNAGAGPYAAVTELAQVEPGDVIQLSVNGGFYHSLVVVQSEPPISPQSIWICAHTYDALRRPLSSYIYGEYRCLHILGAR